MSRAISVVAWNTPTLFLQPLEWAKISFFQAVSAFMKPLAPMIFMTRFKLQARTFKLISALTPAGG
ncbi:hypothetical protein EMIT0P100_300011 [Pseudomonas sp. IT-P100]